MVIKDFGAFFQKHSITWSQFKKYAILFLRSQKISQFLEQLKSCDV